MIDLNSMPRRTDLLAAQCSLHYHSAAVTTATGYGSDVVFVAAFSSGMRDQSSLLTAFTSDKSRLHVCCPPCGSIA